MSCFIMEEHEPLFYKWLLKMGYNDIVDLQENEVRAGLTIAELGHMFTNAMRMHLGPDEYTRLFRKDSLKVFIHFMEQAEERGYLRSEKYHDDLVGTLEIYSRIFMFTRKYKVKRESLAVWKKSLQLKNN